MHCTDHFITIYFSVESLLREKCSKLGGIRDPNFLVICCWEHLCTCSCLMSSMALQRNFSCLPTFQENKMSLQRWIITGYSKGCSKERNIPGHTKETSMHPKRCRKMSGVVNAKKNECQALRTCLRIKTVRKTRNMQFTSMVSQLLHHFLMTQLCHDIEIEFNCKYQEVKQNLMESICNNFNKLRTWDFQPRQIREGTD